jgi:hypothetical protein
MAMTRIRRLIPSPAMVVALIALFMAMGGSAYALIVTSADIKDNTIRTQDVRNGGLFGKDFRANKVGGRAIKESTLSTVPSALVAFGATKFAVVGGGGQQFRGRGTTSTARTGEGRYQVIFDSDVRNCAYFATIGSPTAAGPPPSGEIMVSSLASNVNGVDIRTNDGDDPNPGAPVNRPFHLVVLC